MSKTDFDNKLISFNRNITSNKTKYLKFQRKLNLLVTKYYNFFLGRIYFTSNDGSQNTLFLSTNTSNFKKDKGTDYVLSWKSEGVFNSKFKLLYIAFLHSIKPFGYRMGIKFDKDPLSVEKKQ